MTEGGRAGGDHAPNMASWDDSEAASATTVERVRGLLKRLLAPAHYLLDGHELPGSGRFFAPWFAILDRHPMKL